MVSQDHILGSNNYQYPTPLFDPRMLLQCKINQNFDVAGSDFVIYQIWERDDNTNYLTVGSSISFVNMLEV